MEEAKKELPYTFAVPEDYDGLAALFKGRTPDEQGTIIERMIKCNHPRLNGAEGSKEKLESLLQFLLQYVHDQVAQFDPELKEDEEDDSGSEVEAIERLTSHLYALAQFSQASAAKSVLSVLREKYEE